jgi:hypothetical protein
LLLGSYDSETKHVLETIKEEIAKRFQGKILVALLENLDIYVADGLHVLTEMFGKNRISIMVYEEKGSILSEIYDVDLVNSPEETVYNFLRAKYGIETLNKNPIFDKFDILMRLAIEIFLIRNKEETRGGEYLELMHAIFQRYSDKIWFFKKENIHLSVMLMEYLDSFRVKLRPYADATELINEISRILEYTMRQYSMKQ